MTYKDKSKFNVKILNCYGKPSPNKKITIKVNKKTYAKTTDKNGMAMYLSKRDMNHLIDCCLKAELQEPFLLVNGISNNTFPRLSIDEARVKLNYQPQDNAFEKNHIFE